MTRINITTKQRKTARTVSEILAGTKVLDGKGVLVNSGYSKAIQKNPKVVFESKGFKLALKELGFSVDAADATIAKILRTGKEENQIKASQEIYKRLGAYEQPDSPTTNIAIFQSDTARKIARRVLADNSEGERTPS